MMMMMMIIMMMMMMMMIDVRAFLAFFTILAQTSQLFLFYVT